MKQTRITVYLCESCGWFCRADGTPCGFGRLDAEEYMRKNARADVVPVSGGCCAHDSPKPEPDIPHTPTNASFISSGSSLYERSGK